MGRPPKPKVTDQYMESNEAKHIRQEIINAKQNKVLKQINNMDHPIRAVDMDEKEVRVSNFYQEMRKLPIISIDNIRQVNQRISRFWEMIDGYGMNPSFESLACALGMDRTTLIRLCNGDRKTTPQEVVEACVRAVNFINAQANSYAEYGKTNNVLRIFNAKNNYGYRDQMEIVASQNRVREDSTESLLEEAKLLADGHIEGTGEVE